MSKDWIDDLDEISGLKPNSSVNDIDNIEIGSMSVTEGTNIGRLTTNYTKDDE